MRKKITALTLALLLSLTQFLTFNFHAVAVKAEVQADYVIYPIPHKITYNGDGAQDTFILKERLNVIKDSKVDAATLKRLAEVAALKGMELTYSEAESAEASNLYLAIYNSEEAVSSNLKAAHPELTDLMQKTDAYYLQAEPDKFTVIAKDVDSVFYALTTLYHIFKQVESRTVRTFVIEDYADVVSRGFIEGYYGNPWSTQNRSDLMRWSGYYKLNTYFYAPKDDPKHNKNWRTLYTEEELNTKIKPLAQAGQESKCNFVYALHPYMSNPIRYGNDANYQNDMNIMKQKFAQVIQAGVRQIAILADDAGNMGGANYKRTLDDMTAWLKEQQQTYPDLKLTLPFCAQEYMYWGQDYFRNFPENVQVMMTGGKIWGEVNKNFTETFTRNTGRGPYLWINWPCTDNSKKHLILGGYKDFLHPGVDPAKIEGIVLNPMQQSEPSKVAIFGNAAYSWNIWQDGATADKAWVDSFSFVDNNSAIKTETSEALKELAKHMINQNMDNRVRVLQESVDLAPTLTAFKDALAGETYTVEQIAALEAEFEKLDVAAKLYRQQGNPGLIGDTENYDAREANEQLAPWLDSWDDTNAAALNYLAALRAYKSGNYSRMLQDYTAAETAFKASKQHRFFYFDHYEVAEVGVQHIVPWIKAVDSYLSKKILVLANPEIVTTTYISDVFVNPTVGDIENILDGDDNTSAQFKQPNFLNKDNYVGVEFNKAIAVNNVRFVFGGGKNHFFKSKLQYSTDGQSWQDVSGEVYNRPENSEEPIVVSNLNLPTVKALRLIATENNGKDLWLLIKGIDVNFKEDTTNKPYKIAKASLENLVIAPSGFKLENAYDNNNKSEVWLRNSSNADNIPADGAIVFELPEVQPIGSIRIYQGNSNKGDIPNNAVVEVSTDKQTWHEYGQLTKNEQVFNQVADAKYIRVRNKAQKGVWWRFADIQVYAPQADQFSVTAAGVNLIIAKNKAINEKAKNNKFSYIVDGDEKTLAWMSAQGGGNIPVDAGIELTFGKKIELGDIELLQAAGDKLNNIKVQYHADNAWQELDSVTGAQTRVTFDGKRKLTDKIRILNAANVSTWWQLYEVKVHAAPQASKDGIYSNLQDTADIKVSLSRQAVSLTAGSLALNAGDYIGFDLAGVKALSTNNINVTPADLVFEASKDGYEWQTFTAPSEFEARYVRIINKGTGTQTLTISDFAFAIAEAVPLGKLLSSDIPVANGWGDTRYNRAAFDGNIDSIQKFGGNPRKGNTAVFDFGKKIDVDSLRVYTVDTQTDYIRDSVLELSSDAKNWQPVLTIGDDQTDTDRETAFGSISDANKKTDSNYPNKFYYGNDEVGAHGKGVRYLRLRILADYPNRALAINEIILNQGTYISQEHNAAFSGTSEQAGHVASNMFDGSLSSSYLPATANGTLTYTLNKADKTGAVRILQKGEASLAKVSARLYNTETGQLESTDLGYLAQAINEFVWPATKKLTALTFSWEEKLPEISEVFFLQQAASLTDATSEKLRRLVSEKPADYESREPERKAAYEAALKRAQAVLDSPAAAESSYLTMIKELEILADDTVQLASAEQRERLEELLQNDLNNDEHFYTIHAFTTYKKLRDKAALAVDDAGLTAKDAEKLIADFAAAKAALEYSLFQREQAELGIATYTHLQAENYSKASFNALSAAYTELSELIKRDKAAKTAEERVEPAVFKEKLAAYNALLNALVDVTELKALLARNVDGNLYTEDSYQAYVASFDRAQAALDSATASESDLDAAKSDLQAAYNNLQLRASADLASLIAELEKLRADDYTTETYAALKTALDAAKADLQNNNVATYDGHKERLLALKNALVSVKALKEKLSASELAEPGRYTKDSVSALATARTSAEALLANGTNEQIADAIANIDAAYRALEENAEDLAAYKSGLELLPAAEYEAASYARYKAVYDEIMALEVGNTSKRKLAALKESLAAAIAALKKTSDNVVTPVESREVNLTAQVTVADIEDSVKQVVQNFRVSGSLEAVKDTDVKLVVSVKDGRDSGLTLAANERARYYAIDFVIDGEVRPVSGNFLVEISDVTTAPLYVYDESLNKKIIDFSYSASDKKLTFAATHFSPYTVVFAAKTVISTDDNTSTTATSVINGQTPKLVIKWQNDDTQPTGDLVNVAATASSKKHYQAVVKTGEQSVPAMSLLYVTALLLLALYLRRKICSICTIKRR